MKSLLLCLILCCTKVASFSPVSGVTKGTKGSLTRSRPKLYQQQDTKQSNVTNPTEASSKVVMNASPQQIEQKANGVSGTEESKKVIHSVKVPSYTKFQWYDEAKGRFYESSEEEIPFGTIFERLLDTVEDVGLHARRLPYGKGWLEYEPQTNQQTVVVLGSGWGAHALIKVADTNKLRLIVVSPTNHFVFTPMLPSAAVGTIDYRSMTEAVRAANPLIDNYIEGRAIDVDVENKILTVQLSKLVATDQPGPSLRTEIAYDKLIVSVGCQVSDKIVPGATEHSFKLKTLDDARLLRNAIGKSLEYGCRPDVAPQSNLDEAEAQRRQEMRRKRLRFFIIGGGPTGVEIAGELSDFFEDCTRDRTGPYQKLKDDIQVVLVEAGPNLVPPFEQDLRDHALLKLRELGVDVRLNTFVKEIGDDFIKLQARGNETIETLDVGLTVWAAGIAPVPFVETLLSKLPEEARGIGRRINVDEWLRCPTPTPESFGSILALGDAACFQHKNNSYLPQTAQVAGQQGAFVARMLDRGYDFSVTPPRILEGPDVPLWLKIRGLEEAPGFKFLNLGLLAYLGKGQALSQMQLGDVPIFKYAGSISFILWRSVYLAKQVATRNRVLVLFDWLKCKLFGRDITRL